jgi:hypothetical protein
MPQPSLEEIMAAAPPRRPSDDQVMRHLQQRLAELEREVELKRLRDRIKILERELTTPTISW